MSDANRNAALPSFARDLGRASPGLRRAEIWPGRYRHRTDRDRARAIRRGQVIWSRPGRNHGVRRNPNTHGWPAYRPAAHGSRPEDTMPSDAVRLAQKLIQFPSLYPPGNEKACAEFVAHHLESMGFPVETYEFAPGRPSLVARLGGSFGGGRWHSRAILTCFRLVLPNGTSRPSTPSSTRARCMGAAPAT